MREHREPLAADFRRYYSTSIAECRERGVPLWEVAAMAAHLPPGCAVDRAIDPDWAWGVGEHLLALNLDATRELTWLIERLKTKSKRRIPDPFPRPGTKPPADVERVGASEGFESIEEMDAWFAERRGATS